MAGKLNIPEAKMEKLEADVEQRISREPIIRKSEN
jgi:hypothetical protein